ncbi:hypothetical protein FQA39_LY13113 [Lamprigera yunnana]|nr:hypothetical protein FQA39_LY13113 [Lamprigera yunnana]
MKFWEKINERVLKVGLEINGQIIDIVAVYGVDDNAKVEENETFSEELSQIIEDTNKTHEIKDDWYYKYEGCQVESELLQNARKGQSKSVTTWEQPNGGLRSITDLMLVKQQRKIKVTIVKIHRKHLSVFKEVKNKKTTERSKEASENGKVEIMSIQPKVPLTNAFHVRQLWMYNLIKS